MAANHLFVWSHNPNYFPLDYWDIWLGGIFYTRHLVGVEPFDYHSSDDIYPIPEEFWQGWGKG